MTAVATATRTPYRLFRVQVARRTVLSPSFVRITFTGEGLEHFGDDGPDQRIKVWIPAPGRAIPEIDIDNWYPSFRALPDDIRGCIRTYTTRAVRPELGEVDVDFVLHGIAGPASAWATAATVGDEIAIIGPNRDFGADCGGHEWKPPAGADTVIVAGDETAAPAVARILESIASDPRYGAGTRVRAFLEVPYTDDRLDVPTGPNVDVTWLPRDEREEHGDQLMAAVCAAARDTLGAAAVPPGGTRIDPAIDPEVDASSETANGDTTLWEVADPDAGTGLYAWIAGEAGAVKTIRRHMVNDLGVDRRQITFMGYWRRGRAEG